MPTTTKLVGSATVAKLFGVTPRQVTQLAADGIITAATAKGVKKYDLLLVIQQYIKHLTNKAYGRRDRAATTELENQKLDAEIALKKAKSRVAEIELQELEGKVHLSEDVEALTTDMVLTIRNLILALPGRMATDLAEIDTPAEVYEYIRQEIGDILEELSSYEYNPEGYRQRVRERQGWQQNHEEEAED